MRRLYYRSQQQHPYNACKCDQSTAPSMASEGKGPQTTFQCTSESGVKLGLVEREKVGENELNLILFVIL